MKNFVIVALIVIAGLGIWRFTAGRVDYTKSESVAKAFTAALKSNNIDKASNYWVPSDAENWRTAATSKVSSMQSGTYTRFFETLPDNSAAYVDVPRTPKLPANEKQMKNGDTTLGFRQIDGKWYVCNAPL